MTMEPRIIYKPAFRVVGFSQNGEEEDKDTENLWEQLSARYHEIPGADPDVGYGVHRHTDQGQRYLAGLAVWQDGPVPPGMSTEAFDEHAYAVFYHRGRMDGLPGTMEMVFKDWLPAAGKSPLDGFYFEFYDDHFQPDSEDSIIFIWIPIRDS
jgi:AraC family transcriptional regulator